MRIKTGGNGRGRFRRVSRTRIFAGHPLNVGFYAAAAMVLAYALLTAVISLLFAYVYVVNYHLLLWALLPGMLLGYVILVLERLLVRLKEYMLPHMGKLLTGFLLFFAHTLGYLAFSSIVVTYPLGYIMEKFWGLPGLAGQYSLFSVNFFIVAAILSWLHNLRTGPCRCF